MSAHRALNIVLLHALASCHNFIPSIDVVSWLVMLIGFARANNMISLHFHFIHSTNLCCWRKTSSSSSSSSVCAQVIAVHDLTYFYHCVSSFRAISISSAFYCSDFFSLAAGTAAVAAAARIFHSLCFSQSLASLTLRFRTTYPSNLLHIYFYLHDYLFVLNL